MERIIKTVLVGILAILILVGLFQTLDRHIENQERIEEGKVVLEGDSVLAEYDFLNQYYLPPQHLMFIEVINESEEQALIYKPEKVFITFSETQNPYVQVIKNKGDTLANIILPFDYGIGSN